MTRQAVLSMVFLLAGAAGQARAQPLGVAREPVREVRVQSEPIFPVLAVSLFHPVGLPWSARYARAGLSVNVLYGFSSSLYGVELGAVNRVRNDAHGLQIAGGVNLVGGSVYGLQVAGGVNWGGDGCVGLCTAGLANYHVRVKGIQVSAAFNFARENSWGAMITGGFNLTEDPFDGLQVATASWVGGRFTGLQIGVMNRGRGVTGVQLGVANFSCGRMNGLQLGLFNFAQALNGVQIGAFNVALRGGLPFMVGMNVGWI